MKSAPAIAVASLSGLALNLAFPQIDLFWVAWIALLPLLLLLRGAGWRRGLLVGYAFGLGFFGLLISWISIVGWLAWFFSVLVEASFIGLFGLLWGATSSRGNVVGRILMPAVLWVAVEFLRSLVPFHGLTWGELAQSQHNFPYLLKLAGLAGGWTLSFLLVALNAAVGEVLLLARGGARRTAALVALSIAIAGVLPSLYPTTVASGAPVKVAIVQGNLPEHMDPSFEKDLIILHSHADLTKKLAGRGVGLVVWPESSVGIDPTRNPQIAREVTDAARAAGAPMVVGGNGDVDDSHYKVEAFQVDPQQGFVDTYQKTHLVPFGEYLPGRRLLDWIPMLDQIPADAVAGTERTLFHVAGGTVAPVLSFEGDFGSLVRQRIADGGRLLVVATNTSTWGRTWASAQHAAFSQVRAAENGVWVIHAALSGISEVIAPDGTVAASAPLYQKAILIQTVHFADGVTPYARLGDWLPLLCAFLSLAWIVFAVSRRKRGDTVTRWQ